MNERRSFLRLLGLGGIVAAASPVSAHAESLGGDKLKAVDDKWDMSWADRVKGKYRGVFDSPAVSDGAAVFRATMWKQQYNAVFGLDPKKLSAIVVIRHAGIPMVMNDEYWDKYENKPADAASAAATPADSAPANRAPRRVMNPARASLPKFIADGGIVLACNLAFASVVAKYRGQGVSADDARKAAIANMIPGVILQPSGIFAVMRAQDAGCSYIIAS